MRLLPGQTHLPRRLVRACGSGACQLPTQHSSEGSLLSRCFPRGLEALCVAVLGVCPAPLSLSRLSVCVGNTEKPS